MAWRPDHLVIAGELDNTQFGWTNGWLEIHGFDFRLQLKMAGNCHPDQSGHVDDITADQMIKQRDIPNDQLAKRLMAGEKPPFTWQKCRYLERFSNRNGRVVIQSTRLTVERIGERAFELTDEHWQEQSGLNSGEMHHFLYQITTYSKTEDNRS
ncbi:MAG TPA: hypothetical protein DDZ51_25835 [Planctomycetaceae bacterium]|nr:hypothetical protein [Planctomycetaceae bacterium]